ncbi:MAG: YigZ family protein [Acholeplasmataceae bacterium]
MYYIQEKRHFSITIDKSEFIAVIYPLNDKNDLTEHLKDVKKNYPKATHYCSASVFGNNGEYTTANDDGEPSRTAGVPILEVLKHQNVTNILCVVVRYYGGIKLGAGGLVRAYTKATAEVLKLAQYYHKKTVLVYNILFNYNNIQTIDHYLEQNNITVIEKTFLEAVSYKLALYEEDLAALKEIEYILVKKESLGKTTRFIPL